MDNFFYFNLLTNKQQLKKKIPLFICIKLFYISKWF